MEFRVIPRSDYDSANEIQKGESWDYSELLSRRCDICKNEDWLYDVGHDDSDSFSYLVGLGCSDGYALVCQECFDKHFKDYSWRYDALY